MVIKKTAVKKLASLSALGTGALLFGVPQADAGVVYSGAIDAKVGFDAGNGFVASYTSAALGTAGPTFKFSRATTNGSYNAHFRKVKASETGLLNFGFNGGTLQVFAAGATWADAAGAANNGLIANRYFGLNGFSHTVLGNTSFSNQYALINFGPSSSLYGWIQLSLQVNNAGGNNGVNGPNLTIVDFAFDDSGLKLAAGSLTAIDPTPAETPTPEPANFAMTGLAALALGARGVRSWRASRPA